MTAPFTVNMPTADVVEDIAFRWNVQAVVDTAAGELVCLVPALSIEYRAPLGDVVAPAGMAVA